MGSVPRTCDWHRLSMWRQAHLVEERLCAYRVRSRGPQLDRLRAPTKTARAFVAKVG